MGILLLVLTGLDINNESHQRNADILNNTSISLIFVITVVNVIISALGLDHTMNTVGSTGSPNII